MLTLVLSGIGFGQEAANHTTLFQLFTYGQSISYRLQILYAGLGRHTMAVGGQLGPKELAPNSKVRRGSSSRLILTKQYHDFEILLSVELCWTSLHFHN